MQIWRGNAGKLSMDRFYFHLIRLPHRRLPLEGKALVRLLRLLPGEKLSPQVTDEG